MRFTEFLLLNEEEVTAFEHVKRLDREFKDLAAEYGITLLAGVGWPGVLKNGGWYGGGMGPKGGSKANADSLDMPMDIKVKGFIKELAEKLEGYVAAGLIVNIGVGADKLTTTTPKAGEVLKHLVDGLQIARPPGAKPGQTRIPCVAWFVGLPSEFQGKGVFRFIQHFYRESKAPITLDIGGPFDPKEALKLKSAIKKFSSKYRDKWVKLESGEYGIQPRTHEEHAIIERFIDGVEKFTIDNFGWHIPQECRRSITLDANTNVFAKATQKLSSDKMREFGDLLWKLMK
jgi:hypothetical protein